MRQFHGEHVLGNIFVRPNHLEKVGDEMVGHQHAFDHVSFIITGSATVEALSADGTTVEKSVTKTKGQYVLIRKGVNHRIVALEENTLVLCVYSHRHPDGEVIDEYSGWEGAYV